MTDRIVYVTHQLRNNRWLYGVLGLLLPLIAGWMIGTWGTISGLLIVGVPILLLVLVSILVEPKWGLLIYVNLGFLLGFTRFINVELPLGLALDGVIMLTLMGVILNSKRMNWQRLHHPVFYMLTVWLFYTILEFFNPEAPYPLAWFFHARFFSLNWFYVAIVILVMPITRADIRLYVKIWLGWSLFACFWAFKQQYIGVAEAEAIWLAQGAAKTHVLWGQLRSFSFYSDASQFGAEMAGVTLVCLIVLIEEKNLLRKVCFIILALLFFWGFAVSGTRSALFVLLGGYPAYLVLRRNIRLLLGGVAAAIPIMAILLFTSIGDSNYQIFRIRSALHPSQDASFLVRLENQTKLKAYLKDLPFGAGIGTSGDMGARFSPEHPASIIPPDSWYVEIWIETGVVGLTLYLLMLVGIITVGSYNVWHINDPWLSKIMIALLAEFIGIIVMSYSNPTLGQIPTSTILFINSILFTSCKRWDTVKASLPKSFNVTA
jgi:putative inorganic carbon (HCO3(-)) transporter